LTLRRRDEDFSPVPAQPRPSKEETGCEERDTGKKEKYFVEKSIFAKNSSVMRGETF